MTVREFSWQGDQWFVMGCSDAPKAELFAAKEGLIFAGFRRVRVILEGDASNVYTSIEGSAEDLSYDGSILRDIVMYASWFDSFTCGSIPRDCNRVADVLAHKALKMILVYG